MNQSVRLAMKPRLPTIVSSHSACNANGQDLKNHLSDFYFLSARPLLKRKRSLKFVEKRAVRHLPFAGTVLSPDLNESDEVSMMARLSYSGIEIDDKDTIKVV